MASDKQILDFLQSTRSLNISPLDTREEPGECGPREIFIPATNMAENTVLVRGKNVRKMLSRAIELRKEERPDLSEEDLANL